MAPRHKPIELKGLQWVRDFVIGKAKNPQFCWRDEATYCWLPQNSVRPDGYCGLKIPVPGGKYVNIMLHVLSCAAKMGQDLGERTTVSHLCGVRKCFNPEHLVAESQAVNNSRNSCPGLKYICAHGVNLSDGACVHSPPCRMVKRLKCPYEMDGVLPPESHIDAGCREISWLRGEIVESLELTPMCPLVGGSLPRRAASVVPRKARVIYVAPDQDVVIRHKKRL